MNKKQIIALLVGFALAFIASKLNIGIPTEDIQNGIVSIVILVIALTGHDANESDSILKNKVAITGILNSIFWALATVFKIGISDTLRDMVSGLLLTLQGYYTMNHSNIVHEINGTVGEISPTFVK